jgi:LytS/YehU family sensor histidine kinase
VTNVLLAATCILISNNLKYYLPGKEKQWHILVLGIGLSGLWLLISKWVLSLLPIGSPEYSYFLSKSLPVRFGIGFLLITSMGVVSMLWYTVDEQKEQEKRKSDAEKLAKDAELFKLRQQLQPHFLFNSLNSINALIGSRPDEARRMIQQLSDFLRGTLKREEHQNISFSEELGYLELYLEIEKVRFGHRLSAEIEKDKECEEMKLPPLLLQPIVENAIKFGLYDTTEQVTIRIHARAERQQLVISVENPFDPETAKPRKGTGFGLNSVQRRLQLLFGRNDLLETTAIDHLFTTTIKIPQLND